MTPSASSSVIPSVRSFTSCSSLILPIAASWIIAASTLFCVNLRNRADFCVIHDNRVALYMSMAKIFTDCSWVKYLPGAAFCNGSGYDLCRASFTIHFYHHIGSCFLVPCVISFSITYSLSLLPDIHYSHVQWNLHLLSVRYQV